MESEDTRNGLSAKEDPFSGAREFWSIIIQVTLAVLVRGAAVTVGELRGEDHCPL